MRARLLVAMLLAACPGKSEPTESPPPSSAARGSSASGSGVGYTTGTAKSTPPIGPLAAAAGAPDPTRFHARSCSAPPPFDIGDVDYAMPSAHAAFGARSGLVAWEPKSHSLAVRPIDRTGKPLGPARELDVPANLDRTWGLRALDAYYLAVLGETDFSGSVPRQRLYALVLDTGGAPVGKPLLVDLGDHSVIDSVSPGAAHGVLVYAGESPTTNVKTARLVTLYVDAAGAVSQSVREVPEPVPGDRAIPKFAFGDQHAVAVLPGHLLVDGEMRDSPESPELDGLLVAPTFTGASLPVVGFKLGRDETHHYGTIDVVSGKRQFERKARPASEPVHAPFDEITWVVESSSSGEAVHVDGKRLALPFPGITSHISTDIVWSGEQLLAIYAAGGKLHIGAVPCS